MLDSLGDACAAEGVVEVNVVVHQPNDVVCPLADPCGDGSASLVATCEIRQSVDCPAFDSGAIEAMTKPVICSLEKIFGYRTINVHRTSRQIFPRPVHPDSGLFEHW